MYASVGVVEQHAVAGRAPKSIRRSGPKCGRGYRPAVLNVALKIMGEREFGRAERVALQLRKELAWVLEREVQDPRAEMVTISRVEVSRDLSHARVFVSAPEDHPIAEVVRVLNHAAGYLQIRLGERVRMRYLPRLRFEEDKALGKASRIDALLAEAKSRRR